MLIQSGKLLLILALIGLVYLSAAEEEPNDVFKSSNITPSTLILLGNTLFYIERIKRNWFDARKSCESMGYDLISFDTNEKFEAINSFLDNQNDSDHPSYWTSGNDFLTLGWHVWFPSGWPVAWYYWHPLQPDNFGGIEHCDEFRYGGTKLMNDLDCTLQRYYICERTV